MKLLLWFGKVTAWLMFIWAVLRLGLGFYVGSNFATAEENAWASQRYLGTENSGEAIDGGLQLLVMAIVLGVLVSMAQSLVRK